MLGCVFGSRMMLQASRLPCLSQTFRGTIFSQTSHSSGLSPGTGSNFAVSCPKNISNWSSIPRVPRLHLNTGLMSAPNSKHQDVNMMVHSTLRRAFRHLAESSDAPPASNKVASSSSTPPKPAGTKPTKLDEEPAPTAAQQRRTDWTIVKRLMVNVWPKNDWKTRAIVLFGFVLLVMAKVLNVQVPQIFKSIIDSLNVEITDSSAVWLLAGSLIVGYGAARIGATLSSELLNAVFANISQRAIRKVARETFEHLLNLDLRFHLARQTGGLTRAIDRGTKGISFLLQAIIFRIAPTALEITMVCGILTYKFGWDFAAVTVLAMAAYTWFTVRTTSWRTQFRRDANKADNKAASVAVDSLINFEAVKHFNNEKYEILQYDKHLSTYEKASTKIATSLAFLNSGQNIIFSSALTLAMFLAAQGVVKGTMTIGDVVMVNQLIFQLSLPLNFLGTIYREMRQNLLDMEVLLRLVEDNAPKKDVQGAKPLQLTGGSIRFENVAFGYHPERPIFRDLSFTVPAGKKVAIVGPSGCGKSTVFRLLYRFYDASSGRIFIDDQDITQIQLESLRRSVGVVPQDTPLFHSDILHNIRYGRLSATDDEVIEAAKKANVHESIIRLPEGYKTQVGERGLMISGGEKQRLAVARVMLKDPEILFFDEATSALDAHTESELMKNINTSLLDKARTSIFIAHRLRTVVEADLIIVLKEGSVVEQGNHEELMRTRGLYHSMWQQQAVSEGLEEDQPES
ncbi:iron-sulfur clusters transporter ATM1 [Crepidotus variabilis]|uniref:Iron-sulfur clusters transporter ATM1, mitochondrial n=1 Tax=Crepidotus variabilis TaxID=179855 RepID=A0A9P6ES56_9AGAR|nr:iron-sulfur clusters transporter ATM1 [Crepidotus variabilis]